MNDDHPDASRDISTLAVEPCVFRGCRKVSIIDVSGPEPQISICVFHFTDLQRFRNLHPVICVACGTVAYLARIQSHEDKEPEQGFEIMFAERCHDCRGSTERLHLRALAVLPRKTGDEVPRPSHHRSQNDKEDHEQN